MAAWRRKTGPVEAIGQAPEPAGARVSARALPIAAARHDCRPGTEGYPGAMVPSGELRQLVGPALTPCVTALNDLRYSESRTLRFKNAHCAKVLILPRFSSARPAARCGFYLAIARSAVCFPPSLRDPSPYCDRTKKRPSTRTADSAQGRCSRYAESLVTARASRVARSSEARRRTSSGAEHWSLVRESYPFFLSERCGVMISIMRSAVVPGGKKPMYFPASSTK